MAPRFSSKISLLVLGLGLSCHDPTAAPLRRALQASPHDVLTQHNDNARTGASTSETVLTAASVGSGRFGKLFASPVDDQLYAQPLHLSGVPMGGGVRDVVYAATVNDTVYAFDAATGAALAQRNLLDAAAPGALVVTSTDVGEQCGAYRDVSGRMGIVGTPVIDAVQGLLFVVARSREGSRFVQRLHALDVSTLADRVPPVEITAQVAGNGGGSDGTAITFDPRIQNQRAALLLSGGVVYVSWASHCDSGPYHGWVMGYSATSLQQVFVWNATPDGYQGGIWQGGQGLAADQRGRLYFVTGNGSASIRDGGRSLGCAFVALDPRLPEPVVDWFIPFNADSLNGVDLDLGSSGAVLVPGSNLVLGGSKEGKVYLVDRDQMGHSHDGDDSQIVQVVQAGGGQIKGSPVVWRDTLYLWASGDVIRQIPFTGGLLAAQPAAMGAVQASGPGGMLSLSASGDALDSGVVWANQPTGDASMQTRPGVLRAFAASDVSHELWNSQMNVSRDDAGSFAKFAAPTIANGRVYLATFSNQLLAYGLLDQPDAAVAEPDAAPVMDAEPPPPPVDAAPAAPDLALPPDAAIVAADAAPVAADAAAMGADATTVAADAASPVGAGIRHDATAADAARSADAGRADARLDGSGDGRAGAAPAGGGCSCSVGARPSRAPALSFLIVAALLLRRRRQWRPQFLRQ
jgi:MYXO-CTERM domain-containing protein